MNKFILLILGVILLITLACFCNVSERLTIVVGGEDIERKLKHLKLNLQDDFRELSIGEKFNIVKHMGIKLRELENGYLRGDIGEDDYINPGDWWGYYTGNGMISEGLLNEGKWDEKSLTLRRPSDNVTFDSEEGRRLIGKSGKNQSTDDFVWKKTEVPINHFINQLIRLPQPLVGKKLSEKTLIQVALNLGQQIAHDPKNKSLYEDKFGIDTYFPYSEL